MAEQSEIVFTIVGFPADVEAVTLGEQGTLAVAITATEEALDSGSLILRLLADEGATPPLG